MTTEEIYKDATHPLAKQLLGAGVPFDVVVSGLTNEGYVSPYQGLSYPRGAAAAHLRTPEISTMESSFRQE
jgi:hypothetical protein